MNRMLIDTSIYSHALRGTADVVEVLRGANLIAVSAISIGELLSGFKGGRLDKQNRKELAQFLDSPRVRLLPIDEESAEFYASILDNLKSSGRPIPTNDIWISAAALQHGLPLFSKDKHFEWVPGLILVE
jgi:predicted nucleic acid-binding protein